MRKFFLAAALALLAAPAGPSRAQHMSVSKVEPPNWWTGMRMNQIQLMITGENLSGITARSRSPQVRVTRIYRTPNPSYAFVDIEIARDALEGFHLLTLYNGQDSLALSYPVLKRKPPAGRYQGFDAADVVYLITPDRFANGDTTNDESPGMTEGRNSSNPSGRHGGDLQGIIDHLDYLADLGVGALWLNPLVENNAPALSYHGYGATDFYRIDPRFGTNAQYEEFVAQAHRRGLRVIMDHVSNHIGINHPWMKNLPSADWLNGSVANHQRTAHWKMELADIHSDSSIRTNTTQGWFVDNMPDLNQRNSFVSHYLIENTLWWIESAGLDGIREDTYSYVEQKFLTEWANAIAREYHALTLVGEVWIGDPVFLATYQRKTRMPVSMETGLASVTDFALYDAMTQAFGAKGSVRLIFDCLSKDFLYPDPGNLLTFLDNHDVRRIMYVTQGDAKRTLLALTMLLTLRGIPEILYGTELGMMGGREHGTIRADFPGGFPGDSLNAFEAKGRSAKDQEFFTTVRQLFHLRRERKSLSYGTMI
ncbi:MAG TPA: alpha-amylase family glycosyl hydrolase, partial [Bacteroidota bacterium]|nr:alpha-amylase family glycosyl hydrolase [Bacteroidota bacterium]